MNCMHCGGEIHEAADQVIMDHKVGGTWEKWFLCGWACLKNFVNDEPRDEVLGEMDMERIA